MIYFLLRLIVVGLPFLYGVVFYPADEKRFISRTIASEGLPPYPEWGMCPVGWKGRQSLSYPRQEMSSAVFLKVTPNTPAELLERPHI